MPKRISTAVKQLKEMNWVRMLLSSLKEAVMSPFSGHVFLGVSYNDVGSIDNVVENAPPGGQAAS